MISNSIPMPGVARTKPVVENAPDIALGYLFLAQAYVEKGFQLNIAMELAKEGLSLNPDKEYKPLGHLVLADIYNRLGKHDLEKQELRLARSQ